MHQETYRKDASMEHTYGTSHLRARAAQLMTWLLGPAQNQQRQIMENDRQTRDGITRGNDDPDNRARQAFLSPAQPTTRMPPAEGSPARTAELSARAEALLQRLERQQ